MTDQSEKSNLFSEEEELALREFWERIFELLSLSTSDDDRSGDELESTISIHGVEKYIQALWEFTMLDDPDYTAIKFLRARKLMIDDATKMFIECLRWRIEFDVQSIIAKGDLGFMEQGGEDAEAFKRQVSSGKTYVQGFSKLGGPVVYVFSKYYKSGVTSPKAMEDFIVYAMESIRLFTSHPQSKITAIIDLNGFGLVNMDWKATMFFNKCLEAYYPETLHTFIIINAPWVFQGIWKVLAPMLDPVVRSKMLMAKSTSEISAYIDKRLLIKEFGGDSTWEYEYKTPSPISKDENRKSELLAQRKILIDHYVEATNRWLHQTSPADAELRKFVGTMLRVQYLSLDPYIRGRTAYHEQGNIRTDGLIGFRTKDEPPEWEFSNYTTSRDQLLNEISTMKQHFETKEIDYPVLEFEL